MTGWGPWRSKHELFLDGITATEQPRKKTNFGVDLHVRLRNRADDFSVLENHANPIGFEQTSVSGNIIVVHVLSNDCKVVLHLKCILFTSLLIRQCTCSSRGTCFEFDSTFVASPKSSGPLLLRHGREAVCELIGHSCRIDQGLENFAIVFDQLSNGLCIQCTDTCVLRNVVTGDGKLCFVSRMVMLSNIESSMLRASRYPNRWTSVWIFSCVSSEQILQRC